MEYDGRTDVFRAKTRNGSTLEFCTRGRSLLEITSYLDSEVMSHYRSSDLRVGSDRLIGNYDRTLAPEKVDLT